jgi:hypothetical protein
VGRADVDADVPDALSGMREPVRGEVIAEATDEVKDEALDEAMASIRNVVKELRQYAGDGVSAESVKARWFSPRGLDGTVLQVDASSRADAEVAARHLERLAQRVRAGALPLLEVQEPLREGSTLVLTLAALHGARAPRSA